MASANVVFVLALKKALTHVVAETFGNTIIRLDAGIAGEHLVLAAQAEGLGTCWIGWFNKKTAGKLVGLPDSYEVVALIACGYPDENPAERPRKSLDEIASFEHFRGKNT
jgi:nitroreductase